MIPGGPWERRSIRPSRNRRRSCKESAGLIVPSVSPGKPGEREGALLQSQEFDGDEDLRLPSGLGTEDE